MGMIVLDTATGYIDLGGPLFLLTTFYFMGLWLMSHRDWMREVKFNDSIIAFYSKMFVLSEKAKVVNTTTNLFLEASPAGADRENVPTT
jgi:Co/Zn/Cd efflux system component